MAESSRSARSMWIKHLVVVSAIAGSAITVGVAIVRDIHPPGPLEGLGMLLLGGLVIAGAIAYAVLSTALLAIGHVAVRRRTPAQGSQARSSKIPWVLLVNVTAIVAVVYGIPKYWSARNQMQETAKLKQSRARLPALRTCFELRRWKLDWGDGQNAGTLLVEGSTGEPGAFTAIFSGQAGKEVVTRGKEDVTMTTTFLHSPAEPRPSSMFLEVHCPSGRRYFSSSQETEQESVNVSEPVLVSPLLIAESD